MNTVDTVAPATRKLITKAWKASEKCKFGHYPMAPSVGLTDAQIELHRPAMNAHAAAAKALEAAGDKARAARHRKVVDGHSWVVRRRGAF